MDPNPRISRELRYLQDTGDFQRVRLDRTLTACTYSRLCIHRSWGQLDKSHIWKQKRVREGTDSIFPSVPHTSLSNAQAAISQGRGWRVFSSQSYKLGTKAFWQVGKGTKKKPWGDCLPSVGSGFWGGKGLFQLAHLSLIRCNSVQHWLPYHNSSNSEEQPDLK